MTTKKWFRKAITDKPPYSLGGWKKTQSPITRRRNALSSRPKNWLLAKRRLSTGRALQALANVTRDAETKRFATTDAKYFFKFSK